VELIELSLKQKFMMISQLNFSLILFCIFRIKFGKWKKHFLNRLYSCLSVSLSDERDFFIVHHLADLKEGAIPPLIHGTPITCKVENMERYTTRSKVRL